MAVYFNWNNFRLEEICKDGKIKDFTIGLKLIWLFKSLEESGSETQCVFRVYLSNGKKEEFILPISIVADDKEFRKELSKRLVVVNSNDAIKFSNYISKEIKDLELHEDYDFLTSKLGWQSDYNGVRRFILEKYEPLDAPRIINSSTNFEFTKGSLDGQIKFINEEILPFKNTRLALAISAASTITSFINPQLNIGTLVVNVCGASTTGKSTIVDLAASLFGSPETSNYGLVRTFNATKGFILGMCESRNGIPIILDDVNANGSEHNISDLIYQLAMGEPRGRLLSNGNVQKRRDSWSGVSIITSEYSLLEKNVVSLGGHARTLTLEDVVWTNDASHSDRIKLGVRENFGFLGQIIADKISEIGENELIELHKKLTKQILDKMRYKDPLSNRIASKMAPIVIAAKLLNELFQFKEIDVVEILEMLVELEQKTVTNRAIDDIAYDILLDFINNNSRTFTYEFDPKIIHHLSNSDKLKINGPVNNHYGHIYKAQRKSYVLFEKSKFEELLANNGYSTQIKKILKLLEQKSILVRTEIDRLESRPNKFFCAKHYKFMIPELDVEVIEKLPVNIVQDKLNKETPLCSFEFKNDEAIEEIFNGEEVNTDDIL